MSPWLTRSEAAAYLRWSEDTIDRHLIPISDKPTKGKMRFTNMQVIRKGELPIRILREDVEAILPRPAVKDDERELSQIIRLTKSA